MSRLTITRSPTLDAAADRLRGWWGGLSPRERWLVGTLGALPGLLILVFGIVQPLQTARAQALADIRTYETLTARVRAAGTLVAPGSQPAPRPGAPVEAAQAAARERGVAVTLAPVATGLGGQLTDTAYENLIGWIADVEQTTPLRLRRADLRPGSAPGRVVGNVEFAP